MKKLMIAAAIVCAAVASEAASFTWSTESEQYMPTTWGSKVAGAGQTAVSGSTKTITRWADNGMAFTAAILLSTDGVNWTPSAADVAVESDSGMIYVAGVENNLFVKPADGSKDVYYKVVINGTYTDSGDGSTWTATATIGGTMDDYITLTSMDPDYLTTGTASTWDIAHETVPEPTSGLLLLLGVAGLALRRRRA